MLYNCYMEEKDITLQEQARRLYLSNPDVTIKDVSDEFGIPYETVRDWSKKESWYVRRGLIDLSGLDDDIFAQASMIRKRLFEEIIGGRHSGKDVVALTESWRSLIGINEPPPDTYDRDSILEDMEIDD